VTMDLLHENYRCWKCCPTARRSRAARLQRVMFSSRLKASRAVRWGIRVCAKECWEGVCVSSRLFRCMLVARAARGSLALTRA